MTVKVADPEPGDFWLKVEVTVIKPDGDMVERSVELFPTGFDEENGWVFESYGNVQFVFSEDFYGTFDEISIDRRWCIGSPISSTFTYPLTEKVIPRGAAPIGQFMTPDDTFNVLCDRVVAHDLEEQMPEDFFYDH